MIKKFIMNFICDNCCVLWFFDNFLSFCWCKGMVVFFRIIELKVVFISLRYFCEKMLIGVVDGRICWKCLSSYVCYVFVSSRFRVVFCGVFVGCRLASSGYFPHRRANSFCSGRGIKFLNIILPPSLYDFSYFCSKKFESIKVIWSWFFMKKIRDATFRRRIAILQWVLCLFEAEVFAIVSFAIEMRVSMKCFVWSKVLGSFQSSCLYMVPKICKCTLLIFQWGRLSSWKGC